MMQKSISSDNFNILAICGMARLAGFLVLGIFRKCVQMVPTNAVESTSKFSKYTPLFYLCSVCSLYKVINMD